MDRNLKILVANPPWREDGFLGIRSGARFPYLSDELTWEGVPTYLPFPFHPSIAAALLKKHGFEVVFWDGVAAGEFQESFLSRAIAWKPDLYIQEISVPSYSNDRGLFRRLRAALPDCFLAASGLMAPGWGKDMFWETPELDGGLTLEWEETALELAHRLKTGDPLDGIKGLLHRRNGNLFYTGPRPPPDVTKLPWPLRDDLPMVRYNEDSGCLPTPVLQMYSSRGCPHSCTFCVWTATRYAHHPVRHRDPEEIVSEIQWCLKRWPFQSVYFDDDVFNSRRDFIVHLCETMQRHGLSIPWAAMCRVDRFDRETLAACKMAGMTAVKYEIDSADQKILNGIKKDLDIARAEEVIALTRASGIRVHLMLMVGLPGETEETLKRTWRFVKRIRPEYLQFCQVIPYPGTELFRQATANGWIDTPTWREFTADSEATMRTTALSREDLKRWIRKFNLLRFGLQFVEGPWPFLKTYVIKSAQSPKKLANAGAYFLNLLTSRFP